MKKLLILCLPLFACGNSNYPALPVVENLELQRYLGTWYEIARLPNSFEKGLDRVSATYSLRDNGKITVLNKGYRIGTDKLKEAKGIAYIPDPAVPSKLKVSFFRPFYGLYWVIALDPDYQYSLVGHPDREYLWILSRTKTMDEKLVLDLLEKAKSLGFPIEKVERVKQ